MPLVVQTLFMLVRRQFGRAVFPRACASALFSLKQAHQQYNPCAAVDCLTNCAVHASTSVQVVCHNAGLSACEENEKQLGSAPAAAAASASAARRQLCALLLVPALLPVLHLAGAAAVGRHVAAGAFLQAADPLPAAAAGG